MKSDAWNYILKLIGLISGVITIVSFLSVIFDINIPVFMVVLDFRFLSQNGGVWVLIGAATIFSSTILLLCRSMVASRRKYQALLIKCSQLHYSIAEELAHPCAKVPYLISIITSLKDLLTDILKVPVGVDFWVLEEHDGEKKARLVAYSYGNECCFNQHQLRGDIHAYDWFEKEHIIFSSAQVKRYFEYDPSRHQDYYKAFICLPTKVPAKGSESTAKSAITITLSQKKRLVNKELSIIRPMLLPFTIYAQTFFDRDRLLIEELLERQQGCAPSTI